MLTRILLLALNLGLCALLSPGALIPLCVLIVFSYFAARRVARAEGAKRKWLCVLSAAVTAGVWVLCREGLHRLPLGLSFYSFKILSYLFDVYRGSAAPAEDFTAYAAAVSLFSELLSGPVTRPAGAMEQLKSPLRPSRELAEGGLMLILFGAFKKFVLADRLAVYTGAVFSSWRGQPGLALWAAVFFYTVQIWADFAGYSEMSLGVSALLGLRISENFRRPYLAVGIRDFWRRWHISLSSWLRDYVYIPLGGSRKGRLRRALNVMITFLVSGFWHGSGTGFLLWGAWHGALNLLPDPKPKKAAGVWLCRLLTFLAAALGWIFFRLERAGEGFAFLARMFTSLTLSREALIGAVLPFTGDNTSVAALLTVLFLILCELVCGCLDEKNAVPCDASGAPRRGSVRCALCLTALVLLGVFGGGAFIYMNF